MTVFAANRELREGGTLIFPESSSDRIRAAAVAKDAARRNGAVKGQVLPLITRREFPGAGLSEERERRFEDITVALNQRAKSVCVGADDPLDGMGVAKNFMADCVELIFALIELSVFGVHFYVAVRFLVVNRG